MAKAKAIADAGAWPWLRRSRSWRHACEGALHPGPPVQRVAGTGSFRFFSQQGNTWEAYHTTGDLGSIRATHVMALLLQHCAAMMHVCCTLWPCFGSWAACRMAGTLRRASLATGHAFAVLWIRVGRAARMQAREVSIIIGVDRVTGAVVTCRTCWQARRHLAAWQLQPRAQGLGSGGEPSGTRAARWALMLKTLSSMPGLVPPRWTLARAQLPTVSAAAAS